MAIEIQTAQNVTLNLRAAGLGSRVLARLLDILFIFLWVVGFMVVFGSSFFWMSDSLAILLFLVVYLPIIFYDLVLEFFNNGKSFGKSIMQIQVVNLDGTTPSFGTYLIRWLFRLVDFSLTGGALAVIMVAFSEKSQRLGDLLAGTTVISTKPEVGSDSLEIPNISYDETYAVVYSDVLEKLTDQDISTIRTIINDYRYYNDQATIAHLANRIKEVTDYTFNGDDRSFLKRVVDDYTHMSIAE